MKRINSSRVKHKMISLLEPDLFSHLPVQEKAIRQLVAADLSKQESSTTGHQHLLPKEPLDRLFVPLASGPFNWFLSGRKLWELRRYGRQYTERNVRVGRFVELRKGYNSHETIWGKVAEIINANSINEFFEKVPFNYVIPIAQSTNDAIEIASNILGKDKDNSAFLGFNIEIVNVQNIAISSEFIELIQDGRITTTIRSIKKKYNAGPCKLESDSKFDINVFVNRIVTKKVRDLTNADAVLDGFSNAEEVRNALFRFYPSMTSDDDIQILKFSKL